MANDTVIRSAARAFCAPGWHWDSRQQHGAARQGLNLWFVAEGSGTLRTPDRTFALRAGDCFVLRSWEEHFGTVGPSESMVVPFVCFRSLVPDGDRLGPDDPDLPPRYRRFPNVSFLNTLLERVIEAHRQDPSGAEALHWLHSALMEVARRDRRPPAPAGLARNQADMVTALLREIRANPGESCAIDQMAAAASYSVDHFIRVFRQHAGVTPGEFVVRSRIEAACSLLLTSSHSVTEIADLLGYCDIYAFSKQFHARVGCPPSRYRKYAGQEQPE